jgi:hypothetical protein
MKALTALVMAAALFAGCDKNCQETCSKIYDGSECGIQPGGQQASELQRECVSRCTAALQNTGPMGDYDPNTPRDPQDPKTITNEKQAAAWMDCVAARSCDDLEPAIGYCEPI